MKTFITLISLFLVSQLSFGATAQVNDVATYGGMIAGTSSPNYSSTATFPAGATPIMLSANTGGSANNNFLILYKDVTGAAYQVASGKTFVATSVHSVAGGGANTVGYQFCTGTAALASNDTATAPTGVVYQMGAAGKSVISYPGYNLLSIPVKFNQNLYPCVQLTSGATPSFSMLVIGYEI